MIRWSFILSAALLAGCGRSGPAPVKPFAVGAPDLVVLITGGTHARLELCDCPGPRTAGLSRRSGLAAGYRAAFPNVLLLDAGDVLWIAPGDLRNRYVLRGCRMIGYDAVVLGDQEWAALGAGLGEILAAAPMNYLATNVHPAGALLPTVPVVVRDFGRFRLAVISYLSPGAMMFVDPNVRARLRLDALAAVADRARALKQAGSVVVLVAHADAAELESSPPLPVDLIVRGHTTRPAAALERVGGVPLVKVGGAEHVGAVALRIDGARVAAIDYRAEVLDEHWPPDRRLEDLFAAYLKDLAARSAPAR